MARTPENGQKLKVTIVGKADTESRTHRSGTVIVDEDGAYHEVFFSHRNPSVTWEPIFDPKAGEVWDVEGKSGAHHTVWLDEDDDLTATDGSVLSRDEVTFVSRLYPEEPKTADSEATTFSSFF